MAACKIPEPELVPLTDADIDEEVRKNMARGLVLRSIRDFVNYKGSKDPKLAKIYKEVYSWFYAPPYIPRNGIIPKECTCEKRRKMRLKFWKCPYCRLIDQCTSFETMCGILGWSPDWIRKRIETLTPKDLKSLGKIVGVC